MFWGEKHIFFFRCGGSRQGVFINYREVFFLGLSSLNPSARILLHVLLLVFS